MKTTFSKTCMNSLGVSWPGGSKPFRFSTYEFFLRAMMAAFGRHHGPCGRMQQGVPLCMASMRLPSLPLPSPFPPSPPKPQAPSVTDMCNRRHKPFQPPAPPYPFISQWLSISPSPTQSKQFQPPPCPPSQKRPEKPNKIYVTSR